MQPIDQKKMNKLEIKHIVPYLTYDLPFVCYMYKSHTTDEDDNEVIIWDTDNPIYDVVAGVDIMNAAMAGIIVTSTEDYVSGKGDNFRHVSEIKPILRPVEEYKDIPEIMDNFSEYEEEEFINAFGFGKAMISRFGHISHEMADLMFKHHIDLFFLINDDLAIDVNTIEPNKL